jgi:hypothetical protein
MKVKTALKQSITGAWIAAVLALGALALAIKIPNATTFTLLAFFVLFLIGDVVNIIVIRRRLARDPRYVDEKIK